MRLNESFSGEQQNYLNKVKQRNEKILKITGKRFTATLIDAGLTIVEKAPLLAERQIRELSNQHPEIKNDEDFLKEIIEDSKKLREKSENVTSNSTFAGKVGTFTGDAQVFLPRGVIAGAKTFHEANGRFVNRLAAASKIA